jgi:hypothetical protein
MRSKICRDCPVAAMCLAGYVEMVGHVIHQPGYWARAKNARGRVHPRVRQVTWACPRRKEARFNDYE